MGAVEERRREATAMWVVTAAAATPVGAEDSGAVSKLRWRWAFLRASLIKLMARR